MFNDIIFIFIFMITSFFPFQGSFTWNLLGNYATRRKSYALPKQHKDMIHAASEWPIVKIPLPLSIPHTSPFEQENSFSTEMGFLGIFFNVKWVIKRERKWKNVLFQIIYYSKHEEGWFKRRWTKNIEECTIQNIKRILKRWRKKIEKRLFQTWSGLSRRW